MRGIGLGLLLAIAALGSARASEVVLFSDGRALGVRSLTITAGLAVLELESGGEIAVPLDRIVSVEAGFEDALPEPPPAAPPLAAAEAQGWRVGAGEFADLIADAAARHGLEPSLLAAMARAESGLDPYAVSPKGACGLLQLMPATGQRFGVRDLDALFDVRQNVEGAARYLRWLLDRFGGDVKLAVAAYNAGEGAVDRHGGVPPFAETRDYVRRVLAPGR